jgi:uncharacterized damage-inducible protein DinB
MTNDPRYPIGQFKKPTSVSPSDRERFIQEMAIAPSRLRDAIRGLDRTQLDTPYREGGWTVRQVVHHLPDSHLNAYVRLKLALTEDAPTIKPYDEALWAEVPEAKTAPVEISLDLLDSLHARWIAALRALPAETFERTYVHPESGPTTLNQQLALYAWHGRHHVAQIAGLRERMGWRPSDL